MAAMPLTRRSFVGSQFLFALDDGGPDAAYVKSVSGGGVKGKVLEGEVGPDHILFKHLGAVEIEPITVEVGMSVSRPLFDWIRASWRRDHGRRSGAIVHADADMRARLREDFYEALITETKFPALDGSSNEPAYLSVTIQPENAAITEEGGQRLQAPLTSHQKQWTASSFRLELDGIDCSKVNKIDSFSVKQKVKQLYSGSDRLPELEPTGLEFGNLSLTMAVEHAGDFIRWHHEYVVRGGADTRHERPGVIEFLDPSRADVLFSVTLDNVGIFSLTIDKSDAGGTEIKRCKVELYVESMDLDYGRGIA
jgi:hypothetical protein